MTDHDSWILVVDDDLDIRELICLLLEANGFKAISAADGCEAMERLSSPSMPALILLDLMMPRLSGSELMERIKGDPQLRHIPVVVISGAKSAPEMAATIAADDCLKKPVGLQELLGTVRRFVAVPPPRD